MEKRFPALYAELRALAASHFRGGMAGQTLQPTALVNEVFVKLAGASMSAHNDSHLFAVAATAMRQILVDHARRRHAQKRGGEWQRVTVTDGQALLEDAARPIDMLILNDLLEKLARVSQAQAKIVDLRFFGGQTVPEVADTLDMSVRSVERHWRFARAWLRRHMDPLEPSSSPE